MTVLGDYWVTRVSTMMTFAGVVVDYPKYIIPDGTDSHNYLQNAGHAKLYDRFYFFGGQADPTQIGFLTGCVIQKTSYRLPYGFYHFSSAIFHFKTSKIANLNNDFLFSLLMLFKWTRSTLPGF
jgi:hypothetical protein